jgi:D-alanyl-D-alanine carboxypeptidase
MQRVVSVVRLLAGCALLLGVAAWGAGSSAMPGATRDAVAASGTAGDPAFTFTARRIGASMRARMTGSSWRPGCPVALSDLRLLRIGYWGFDRRPHVGRMIVAASAVDPVRRAFEELFGERFPIRRMRLIDDYDGSDHASIEADNTSAFNCRKATGSSRFSEHAYGRAIDVNPIENPYVYPDGTTVHRASRPYLDRSRHRRGMAYRGGVLVRAFTRVGWSWGGDWRPPSATDFQHFSATGR